MLNREWSQCNNYLSELFLTFLSRWKEIWDFLDKTSELRNQRRLEWWRDPRGKAIRRHFLWIERKRWMNGIKTRAVVEQIKSKVIRDGYAVAYAYPRQIAGQEREKGGVPNSSPRVEARQEALSNALVRFLLSKLVWRWWRILYWSLICLFVFEKRKRKHELDYISIITLWLNNGHFAQWSKYARDIVVLAPTLKILGHDTL